MYLLAACAILRGLAFVHLIMPACGGRPFENCFLKAYGQDTVTQENMAMLQTFGLAHQLALF